MFPSLGILFAILAMALWGLEELFLKESLERLRSTTTYFINTISGVLLQTAVIFLVWGGGITLLAPDDFLLAVLSAGVAFLGFYLFYLALERQKLSLISSLDESWIIVTILIAVFFFGETLSPLHIFSIVIVLSGALLISADISNLRNLSFISGSGYEFFSVILIGVSIPLEKMTLDRIGEVNSVFYLSILIIPFILITKFIRGDPFRRASGRILRIAIYSGFADGLAFLFYLLAIKSAAISIVSPIIASSVVVSVFLARIYLKERMAPKEIFGTCFILAGVIILSILAPT